MAIDFVVALFYIGIIWSIGQWTIERLYKDDADSNYYLLSFVLGFSELTLLSTFLYFTVRMPMQVIRIAWLLLGCVSFIDMIKRHEIRRSTLAILSGIIGLWMIMLIPGLISRDQYYVYWGNCWDQQTYVEETVALSMHPIGWYESRTKEEIELVSDVLWRGYGWAVNDRPSAGIMIAVLRCNPAGEIYWVVYMYRMFVISICMPSLLFLFNAVLGGKSLKKSRLFYQQIIWIIVAVLYCIGFWGQIQNDIDAVSQISAIAVLSALTAVFLCYAQNLVKGDVWNKEQYFTMILFASAGLALYLENALVHAAMYLVTGLLLLICNRKKLIRRQIIQLVCIPVISLGMLILTNYKIVNFMLNQINTSLSDIRQSWADYFNAWWLGKYGIDDGRITGPVSRVVNCIVSTSGMYNMTANYERYDGMAENIMTGIVVLLAILVIFCILRPLVKKMQQPVWMLWVAMMTGIVAIIGMCVGGKFWSAGKFLYYISPYLYTFLCIPALRIKDCKGIIEKAAMALAILMIFSNGMMVLAKYKDVKVNYACLGYRGTYPSDMIPGLKMTADFTFDTKQLEGVDSVIIRDLSMVSDNQFYLQYLKVKLTCAEITWIPENDIDYQQNKVEISQKRVLVGNPVTLEALQNNNGRYTIVIK